MACNLVHDGNRTCPVRNLLFELMLNRVYLDNFLTKPGPFTDESFVPGQDTIEAVANAKIL